MSIPCPRVATRAWVWVETLHVTSLRYLHTSPLAPRIHHRLPCDIRHQVSDPHHTFSPAPAVYSVY